MVDLKCWEIRIIKYKHEKALICIRDNDETPINFNRYGFNTSECKLV